MRRIVHLAAFLALSAAGAAMVAKVPPLSTYSDFELVAAVVRRAVQGDPSMLCAPWFLRPLVCALAEAGAGIGVGFCLTWLVGMGDNDTYGYAIASGVGRTTVGIVRLGWIVLRVAVAILIVLLGARFMLLTGQVFQIFD